MGDVAPSAVKADRGRRTVTSDPARRRPRRALCASRPQLHCPRVRGQTAADRGPGGRKWDVEVWAGPQGGSFRPRPAPDVCWPSWPASAGGHFAPALPSSRGRLAGPCPVVLPPWVPVSVATRLPFMRTPARWSQGHRDELVPPRWRREDPASKSSHRPGGQDCNVFSGARDPSYPAASTPRLPASSPGN